MEKKNNIIKTLFFVYIISLIYIIASGIGEYGIDVGRVNNNISNGYYYLMIIAIGIVSAVYYVIYLYLMDKWNITIRCPHCNRTMDIGKIKINPGEGFLCTQICQNCGKEFTPDPDDDKGK